MTDNYSECLDYLSSAYEEVNGYDFYKNLFPNNENSGDHETNPPDKWIANAIFLYKDEADEGTERTFRQRIMLNDTWEDDYMNLVENNPFTLCSGVAFRGKKNWNRNAREMYALIIDLDGVGGFELKALFHSFQYNAGEYGASPIPTFIVISGSGVHLYYVFDNPIALYPNIKPQMTNLKKALINNVWVYGSTSQIKKRQYGNGFAQSFRMVGSINDRYNTVVRAFEIGDRVSLEYLNSYVMNIDRADVNPIYSRPKYTQEEMKTIAPDWHEDVIVNGNKRIKQWKLPKGHKGDELYNWWLRHLNRDEIGGGCRYHYMMILSSYAAQGGVPKERLESDLWKIFEVLKRRKWRNELTDFDVKTALRAYDNRIIITKQKIKDWTGIEVTPKIGRNGAKQNEHLEEARALRDLRQKRKGVAWDDNNGRKPLDWIIKQYQAHYPEARKIDCINDTGLSKTTVYKWW